MSKFWFNSNSGYLGSSMSIRAADAYDRGCKPLSKWNKSDLLDEVCMFHSQDESIYTKLKKYSLSVLRNYFLEYDSWHHTGSYFNKTTFYKIDEESSKNIDFDRLDRLQAEYKLEHKQAREEAKKNKLQVKKVLVTYDLFIRSRGKIRYDGSESKYGLLINNYVYFADGSKKSINGNYIRLDEEYSRAPKNTAHIFKRAMSKLPKSILKKI